MELETRAEFQDKAVDDLDEVIREFTRRVERLEKEFAEIRAELLALTGGQAASQQDTPPT